MTDHQPVHEQVRVQDQTDHGPRRTPGRYQRSPRGTMKCRPVIVAIMPGIPKPVLETGVEDGCRIREGHGQQNCVRARGDGPSL